MPTKNTPRTSKTTPARRVPAKVEAKDEAKRAAKPAVTEVKKQITEALENARETTKSRMLAGMGLIARMRKQREERFAELVAEGKRVQPKIDQAIEDLKNATRVRVLDVQIEHARERGDRAALSKLEPRRAKLVRQVGEPKLPAVTPVADKGVAR